MSGKVEGAAERFAVELLPVLIEALLELGDGGSLDAVLGIAPFEFVSCVAEPGIGKSRSAGEGDAAIGDEDLTMSAVVHRLGIEGEVGLIEMDFDAMVAHGLKVGGR